MGHLNETQVKEIVENVKRIIKAKGSCELSAHFRNANILQYNMDDIVSVYDYLTSDGKYYRNDIGNMHLYIMKPVLTKWYKRFLLPKIAEMIITAALALAVGWLLQTKERQEQSRQYEQTNQRIDSLRQAIKEISAKEIK